ncbi:signal recognition particle-docking protein FtsY [Desulfonatronospira thiodismutans ASO3-1]|uniref:Signal recognition particle receptor FtsY n=1 Tax=Desulfonatronospira thiodismutans ASO3-1 TaxID=555779 RepID=D6SMF8_9BACT|nr:signal recognition particle-docking protein FtsY [Desulfonatronospira thiodismutans]EFI35869.1 signal recognition particle-docking protein FtsY [Desulfonatronospira thiodismutans ASO3-1]
MGFFSKIKNLWKSDAQETTEKPEIKDKPSPATPDAQEQEWQAALKQSLAAAEPRLSVWLDHLLQGVDSKGELLWQRLYFFFDALEIPREEAEDFVARFSKWLDDMGYTDLEEFRSELQYRLALALDLEDEEDEKSRLFIKLSHGLSKTKAQLSRQIDQLLSSSTSFDEAFWEELEEILIMSDVGHKAATELVQKLRTEVSGQSVDDPQEFKQLLGKELAAFFPRPQKRIKPDPPEVILMIGVNGVGKTTTIAKLAHRDRMKGRRVMIAAGDTFRAAAIEQLGIWAERADAEFYAKSHGADPASVAYEALDKAVAEGTDVLYVDTAGRLHTKSDLMQELKKMKSVMQKKRPGSPHRTILVLDATTGQNAMSQTELFAREINIDEIILTKLDGTAKGGVMVAIALQHQIPITFIGLGEKMEDLRPFEPESFARALLG